MLETSTVPCSGRQSGLNFTFELNVWLPVGRPEYDVSSVVDWMLTLSRPPKSSSVSQISMPACPGP
jgi:hypothetical protein